MNQTIDFQIIFPRIQDVSRIQHIQQRNEQMQQQFFAVHLANESERVQRTVQNPSHAKEAMIKEKKYQQKWTQQHQQEKPSVKKKGATQNSDETITTGNTNVGRYIDLKI